MKASHVHLIRMVISSLLAWLEEYFNVLSFFLGGVHNMHQIWVLGHLYV